MNIKDTIKILTDIRDNLSWKFSQRTAINTAIDQLQVLSAEISRKYEALAELKRTVEYAIRELDGIDSAKCTVDMLEHEIADRDS